MNVGDSLAKTASIVVPVYNEEDILEVNTIVLHDYLDESLDDFELLLVENGSIDKTALYAEKLASNNPRIKTIHLSEPCLGAAIKAGVSDAMFDISPSISRLISASSRRASVFWIPMRLLLAVKN